MKKSDAPKDAGGLEALKQALKRAYAPPAVTSVPLGPNLATVSMPPFKCCDGSFPVNGICKDGNPPLC